jgi:hypothetical protein
LSAQRKTPWRQLETVVVLGELALDGRVRPVRGVLSAVLAAKGEGWKDAVVPVENLPEATRCSSNPVNTPLSNSAAGSEVTSCPFAEAVRAQYLRQGLRATPVTLNVMSPVTDEIYVMNCIGSQVVTCTGGNDAVVHLYWLLRASAG